MSEDPIHLVEVKEAESIAKTLANKTCQQILSCIQEKKSLTATEIATELKLPLSTVQYNLKSLAHAEIISDEEFHYSEKGKKVPHYSASEKVIVIIPRTSTPDKKKALLDSLQTLIPGLLTATVAAVGIAIATSKGIFTRQVQTANAEQAAEGARILADTAIHSAEAPVAAKAMPMVANETLMNNSSTFFSTELAWGILIGMTLIAITTIAWSFLKIRKKSTDK